MQSFSTQTEGQCCKRKTRDWYIEKVACFLNITVACFCFRMTEHLTLPLRENVSANAICGPSETQRIQTLTFINLSETAFIYSVVYQCQWIIQISSEIDPLRFHNDREWMESISLLCMIGKIKAGEWSP